MITCAEAVRELWNYLDGLVDETERAAVEKHLDVCRRCCGECRGGRTAARRRGPGRSLPCAAA